MAAYTFETITAAQALAFTSFDTLTVASGPASAVTVIFGASGDVSLQLGGRTVDFHGVIASVSQAGGVTFSDGSVLYIGGPGADAEDLGIFSKLSGAIYGGGGGDTITTGQGSFLIQGNSGDDQITAGPGGHNTIFGGQGDDFVTIGVGGGVPQTGNFIQGNLGNDEIFGGAGDDTILGGKGDDTISGNGGKADFINGNLGNDNLVGVGQLFGEDGNDTILAAADGPSTVSGGAGDDVLRSTILNGTTGAPSLIHGDDGNDLIQALSPAHDELHGDAGADTVTDFGTGDDSLDGGDGDDLIQVGSGHATATGGAGNDTIEIRGGGNVLFGGSGGDLFMIETTASRAADAPALRNMIMDWASEDHIRNTTLDLSHMTYSERTASDETEAVNSLISMAPNEIVAVQVGTEVIVFMQPNVISGLAISNVEAIVLVGRTLADIDASNFI